MCLGYVLKHPLAILKLKISGGDQSDSAVYCQGVIDRPASTSSTTNHGKA
jgi:hypothetical protein